MDICVGMASPPEHKAKEELHSTPFIVEHEGFAKFHELKIGMFRGVEAGGGGGSGGRGGGDSYADFKTICPHYVSTQSRSIVVPGLWETVCRLNGIGVRQGFDRVIVGDRGVGKSFVLSCIAWAALQLFGPQFLVLRIRVKLPVVKTLRKMLFDYLVEQTAPVKTDTLKVPLPSEAWSDIYQANSWLGSNGLTMLCVIDEAETLYRGKTDTAQDIIYELNGIGDLDMSKHILAFITGSSPLLRPLLFQKMPRNADKEKWYLYPSSPSMNRTKYKSRMLYPLRSPEEMKEALVGLATNPKFVPHLRAWSERVSDRTGPSWSIAGIMVSHRSAYDMLVKTRGRLRLVVETIEKLDRLDGEGTAMERFYKLIDDRCMRVIKVIITCLGASSEIFCANMETDPSDFDINKSILAEVACERGYDSRADFESDCHHANDLGVLTFMQDKVGILNPGDGAYIWARMSETKMNPTLSASLFNPGQTGMSDVNEPHVFSAFTSKYGEGMGLVRDMAIDPHNAGVKPPPEIATNAAQRSRKVTPTTLLNHKAHGKLRKLVPDLFGADGIAVHFNDDGTVRKVLFMQVKLSGLDKGGKSHAISFIDDIINKMDIGKAAIVGGIPELNVPWQFVVVCSMRLSCTEAMKKKYPEVTFIYGDSLWEMWPEPTRKMLTRHRNDEGIHLHGCPEQTR